MNRDPANSRPGQHDSIRLTWMITGEMDERPMTTTRKHHFANLLSLMMVLAMISGTAIAEESVLLEDDFDDENSGSGETNYSSFTNWEVVQGSVDLIPVNGEFDFLPGNGLYVDLDGTLPSPQAGWLESTPFPVSKSKQYRVEFWLAGSQRLFGSANNVVDVVFNETLLQTIVLPNTAPFTLFVFDGLMVPADSEATLRFQHFGGDNVGLLLDRVRITEDSATGCLITPGLQHYDFLETLQHEFTVQVFRDGVPLPPRSTLESIEIVSGPNQDEPPVQSQPDRSIVDEIESGPIATFEYIHTGEGGTDTIVVDVVIDGQSHSCLATVTWQGPPVACFAGPGRIVFSGSGLLRTPVDRHVVRIDANENYTWEICGVGSRTGTGQYVFGPLRTRFYEGGTPVYEGVDSVDPTQVVSIDYRPSLEGTPYRGTPSSGFIITAFGRPTGEFFSLYALDDYAPCQCDP